MTDQILSLNTAQTENLILIEARGPVTLATIQPLQEILADSPQVAGVIAVILDIRGVAHIDGSFSVLLTQLYKRLVPRSARIYILLTPDQQPFSVLKRSGFDRILHLVNAPEELPPALLPLPLPSD